MEEIKYVIPPYGTSPSSSFCEELRQMQKCVILCMVVTTTILCCSMFEKLDFSAAKVGRIACCDHKMSSASSLSLCQAVCCTEFSLLLPWALAGHTSCHPSPTVPPSLSLSVFSLHLCLNQGAVTHASLQPFLPSLTP